MSAYVAKLYQASSPEAEYVGALLLSMTQNLRAETIRPVLSRNGLQDFDPTAYYSQQKILNVLREIEQSFTFEELVAIGIKSTEVMPLPPEVTSLEVAIMGLGAYYKSLCRNIPPEEGITIEWLGERHARTINNQPTPPFIVYGNIYGVAKQFRTENVQPVVLLTKNETPFEIEIRW